MTEISAVSVLTRTIYLSWEGVRSLAMFVATKPGVFPATVGHFQPCLWQPKQISKAKP